MHISSCCVMSCVLPLKTHGYVNGVGKGSGFKETPWQLCPLKTHLTHACMVWSNTIVQSTSAHFRNLGFPSCEYYNESQLNKIYNFITPYQSLCRAVILYLHSYTSNKNILYTRRLVVYRNERRRWCKKQGNRVSV